MHQHSFLMRYFHFIVILHCLTKNKNKTTNSLTIWHETQNSFYSSVDESVFVKTTSWLAPVSTRSNCLLNTISTLSHSHACSLWRSFLLPLFFKFYLNESCLCSCGDSRAHAFLFVCVWFYLFFLCICCSHADSPAHSPSSPQSLVNNSG